MKDGNEGHGMNKKYEKFKLAVGTTFAFFILVAVMGIAFVQNRYADENILEDELLEIQGDEKFHYVETGITYWQYKDTEGEPSIDSNGKRWNEAGYLTEDWKEAKGSFGSYYGELNDRVGGKYPSNLLNYYSAKKKALPVYYFRTEFEVDDAREIFQLSGEIQFDDSVIIYLNVHHFFCYIIDSCKFHQLEDSIILPYNNTALLSQLVPFPTLYNCRSHLLFYSIVHYNLLFEA